MTRATVTSTSRDFLDSGTHPTMTFTAASAQRTGERTFVVMGELELLGTRRPLVLEATLNKTAPYPIGARAEVMGVSLRGSLKRSEFGMTYGVADGLVGDDVELLIELEARARRAAADEEPSHESPRPHGSYACIVVLTCGDRGHATWAIALVDIARRLREEI